MIAFQRERKRERSLLNKRGKEKSEINILDVWYVGGFV